MTLNDSKPKPDRTITECRRCGTCCKKGGPSFHIEDKVLVEKGIILSRHLYTIRKGELSFDNVKECILPASTEIIKIKGRKGSWTCVFFDEKNNECTIYDTRPMECRVLKCWDTREIEKIYAKNRLTRKDLISSIEGLWDLVEDHQKQCAYDMLTLFIDALNKDKKDVALKGILEIIEHDKKIRELVVRKAGLESDLTDFLFGRPITETIKMYGLKIEKDGDKYLLVPTGGRTLND
ncbi:MAG: YkgJ family cysteine cluster protein [Deltaproteobacteria bacterium]|nr:YkgJ family cysteine cluster protein [Deltaproteobacteria bacterium]